LWWLQFPPKVVVALHMKVSHKKSEAPFLVTDGGSADGGIWNRGLSGHGHGRTGVHMEAAGRKMLAVRTNGLWIGGAGPGVLRNSTNGISGT